MDPIGQPGSVQTAFPCESLYTPAEDKEKQGKKLCVHQC